MEATIQQKKKNKAINKGKLKNFIKKTYKTFLCRPDPIFWPLFPDDKGENIISILRIYKIDLPEFKKLKWSELKLLSKAERPKPPELIKRDGLIFGINECHSFIKEDKCKAVLLDADIHPQLLVHHIIESCQVRNIPIGCVQGLKKECKANFGIPACCLGITDDTNVGQLRLAVEEHVKSIPKLKIKEQALSNSESNKKKTSVVEIKTETKGENDIDMKEVTDNSESEKKETSVMEIKTETKAEIDMKEIITDKLKSNEESEMKEKEPFQYLYRTSNRTRVFVPPSSSGKVEVKGFGRQNFIGFTEKEKTKRKKHLKDTIVKKISNNPKRCKVENVKKHENVEGNIKVMNNKGNKGKE